eukprot:s1128_g4.t1
MAMLQARVAPPTGSRSVQDGSDSAGCSAFKNWESEADRGIRIAADVHGFFNSDKDQNHELDPRAGEEARVLVHLVQSESHEIFSLEDFVRLFEAQEHQELDKSFQRAAEPRLEPPTQLSTGDLAS